MLKGSKRLAYVTSDVNDVTDIVREDGLHLKSKTRYFLRIIFMFFFYTACPLIFAWSLIEPSA